MNAASEFGGAWDGIRRSYEAGRLAHAYIVVGSPRGAGTAFTESVLQLIFGVSDPDSSGARRIAQRAHPDVVWIEPQSKSRLIRVNEVRVLNHRLQQTAMEGDWKAGVILYADRMNDQAANAFLKTLEEPVGRTLLLLLTETPQAMLPTIRSRCQQIVLSRETAPLDEVWLDRLRSILRAYGGRDPMQVLLASDALRELLDAIKKDIESSMDKGEGEDQAVYDARVQSRLIEIRAQVMAAFIQWQRDVLCCAAGGDAEVQILHFPEEIDAIREQARGLSCRAALQRVSLAEEMARRLDRNVPPLLTFQAGLSAQLLGR